MRANQIAEHVPSQQAACLLSGSYDKSERGSGETNNNLSVKNAPDIANTNLTAGVNKSHNKGNTVC